MSARVLDELLDHPKLAVAGQRLGKNGGAIALGFYVAALLWCNRQLTDGVIPINMLGRFKTFVLDPAAVADALVTAGLFEAHDRGYRIHDYGDVNPSAADVKKRRREDMLRKRRARGNGHA